MPSEETNNLMRSLDRPISDTVVDPTMLFGVNFDVDYMNQQKLDEMPGPAKIYKAVDSGKRSAKIDMIHVTDDD